MLNRPATETQITHGRRLWLYALVGLIGALAQHYPVAAVVGHEHVAPGRKNDPGAGFDWSRLRSMLDAPRRYLTYGEYAKYRDKIIVND